MQVADVRIRASKRRVQIQPKEAAVHVSIAGAFSHANSNQLTSLPVGEAKPSDQCHEILPKRSAPAALSLEDDSFSSRIRLLSQNALAERKALKVDPFGSRGLPRVVAPGHVVVGDENGVVSFHRQSERIRFKQ